MVEFLRSPAAQLVIGLAVTSVLVAVGVYVIGKVRGSIHETELSASDLLTNFRELHNRGGLSDDEYRTIKAKLSTCMEQELKDSGKEV